MLVDYLMCSVLMKKSFLRNWACAIHFFALCYIFSLTSHWSFDPIFVLCPPRIVMLHHLILFLRCFLIFRTFTGFSYTYKNRADQWFLLSQCRVNEIFFLMLRNWVCAIHFLPRTKNKELLLLSVLYIFLGQRLCV